MGTVEKLGQNISIDMINLLKNEGYIVKKGIRYKGYGKTKSSKYTLDIFAYKGINDIICIEFPECENILSRENENKWKSLIARPGLDLHLIVPPRCREKLYLKYKIKNIPMGIYDYNNYKDEFELNIMKLSK